MKLESRLKISQKLKERAENDYELRKNLYHAYNERKCYGFDVLELPVDDNESLFSQCDGNLSDIAVHSSSNHNSCYNI